MSNLKLKYTSLLLSCFIIFLLSGCKTELRNDITISKNKNEVKISGNSYLSFDKDTSKLLLSNKEMIDGISEILNKNTKTINEYIKIDDKISFKTPLLISNSKLFGLYDILIKKEKKENYSISINYEKPTQLLEAISKTTSTYNDKDIRDTIILENIIICNKIFFDGKILSIKYNKDIWNIESKYLNEITLCSSLNKISNNNITINITLLNNSSNVFYLLIIFILLIAFYIIKKIRN